MSLKKSKRKASDCGDGDAAVSADLTPRKIARIIEAEVMDDDEDPSNNTATWSKEECQLLLELVTPAEKVKNVEFKTALKKVDWSSISVRNHSGEDARKMMNTIIKNVRRYRTIQEILDDCLKFVDSKAVTRILMPKVTSVYMAFHKKCARQMRKENPTLSLPQLTKMVAEKYHNLSKKKRKRYEEKYNAEKAKYDAALDEFKNDHPEIYPKKKEKVAKGNKRKDVQAVDVDKPKNAKQIYLDTQVNGKIRKHPEKSREKLVTKFTKKWQSMTEANKEPWTILAVDDKIRYRDELAVKYEDSSISPELYRQLLEKFTFAKHEALIKLHDLGKPKSPAMSGYQRFLARRWHSLHQQTHEPNLKSTAALMSSFGHEWKSLTEVQKEKYNDKAKAEQSKYQEEYKEWKLGLSPSHLNLVEILEESVRPRKRESRVKRTMKSKRKDPAVNAATGESKTESDGTKKQTTIIDHFSPKSRKRPADDNSDSGSRDNEPSPVGEQSDHFHPADENGDLSDVDVFESPKLPISMFRKTPHLQTSTPAPSSSAQKLTALRLTPPMISPLAHGTPSKRKKFRV